MRILLDTHVYLWWLQDDPKLSVAARSRMDAASAVFVSSASIWEAAIKKSTGKLDVDVNQLVAAITGNGLHELPVSAKHAAMVARLPVIHRDPFDRVLIAQSLCEPMRFLTADRKLSAYSELVVIV